jgi:hypothetical protein
LGCQAELLFNLSTVGGDERLAPNRVGDLGDMLVREAMLEVCLQGVLQAEDCDERVFGALVPNNPTNLFFYCW